MIYTSVNLCLQEKKEGINTYDPAQFAWFFYFVPNILSTITSKKILTSSRKSLRTKNVTVAKNCKSIFLIDDS